MGGIASALGEGAEKLGQDVTRSLESTETGQKVLSIFGNKENELNLTPQGKAIGSMLQEYHRIKNVTLDGYNKDMAEVKNWHQSSDTVRNTLPMETATVGDMYKHAAQTNQPVSNTLGKIINSSINPQSGASDTAQMTLKELSLYHKSSSRLAGLSGSVGSKMENVSPLIASLLEHNDPRVQMNGHAVADIVSNELKDTTTTKRGDVLQQTSKSKQQMNQTFGTVNRFREKAGVSSRIPLLRTDPTYVAPSTAERIASSVLRTVQIPFVAIPHIGQYFHLPATAPLQSIGKALLGMNNEEMNRVVDASGILANTEWDVIHSDIAARTGTVAKWTNSPTAASIIQKSIHTPGFSYLRLKQLASAGAVGYHSAIFWAENAMRGDKRALAELSEMGIDPSDVLKQKGKLTEAQLQKGVYHFVNNRFFFDRTIDRALYSNRNFFMRTATMYHGFISSETAFIRRELQKQLKSGDLKGIAQFVGTLGVVFPYVAPMLKSAELLARTGSPSQAGASIKKDYASLTGQNGAIDFAETYLDMVAHIGAMGVARNYTQAIKGHRLANAMLGPMLGMTATDIEDLYAAGSGASVNPLGRDVMEMIPVAGKPLAHQLFPTRAESGSSTTGLRPHDLSRRRR